MNAVERRGRQENGQEIKGVGGRETAIRVYCKKNNLFSIKEKRTNIKQSYKYICIYIYTDNIIQTVKIIFIHLEVWGGRLKKRSHEFERQQTGTWEELKGKGSGKMALKYFNFKI